MAAALPSHLELIPPAVRHRLLGLRLNALFAVGRHGVGQHTSRSRGSGLEFAQYRAYEAGDELRLIDWKLYARSDRFFVREAERESPLHLWIVIDATASMQQSDEKNPTFSRLEAAKGMAACVAELALRQNDNFGLLVITGQGLEVLPAGSGIRQRDQLWLKLYQLKATGQWPDESKLRPLWERISPNDWVLMLGDGFEPEYIQLAEKLSLARREVVSIQILTAEERDFPYNGGFCFIDPETGQQLQADGSVLKKQFLEEFQKAQQQLQRRFEAAGIRHQTYYLDQALDAPLQVLLGKGKQR